jgi:hypothetical protein
MNPLRNIERAIDEKLRGLFRSPGSEAQQKELVEVHRGVLDEVASKIERLPRSRTVFPYSHVVVRVRVPAPERRRAYEVVFLEGEALAREVRARLEDEGAELTPGLHVDVTLAEELPAEFHARGFDVSYAIRPTEQAARPSAAPGVKLTITNGVAAGETVVTSARSRINLGRLADVLDAQQRPVRRNDVAFADAEGPPNSTVSRSHAHISWDAEAGRHRLFDDRSAYGTTVARGGHIIPVPKGTGKGVALEHGDEILLGQARVLFELA